MWGSPGSQPPASRDCKASPWGYSTGTTIDSELSAAFRISIPPITCCSGLYAICIYSYPTAARIYLRDDSYNSEVSFVSALLRPLDLGA